MRLEHSPAFDFDTAANGELVTSEVCAQILKMSPKTLAKYRCTGKGIPYVKFAHGVRYTVGDIKADIAKRRRLSTTKAA